MHTQSLDMGASNSWGPIGQEESASLQRCSTLEAAMQVASSANANDNYLSGPANNSLAEAFFHAACSPLLPYLSWNMSDIYFV